MPASWRAWLAQADAVPSQPAAAAAAAAASAAGGVPAKTLRLKTTLPLLPSVGALPSAGALLLLFALGLLAARTLALVWRWSSRRWHRAAHGEKTAKPKEGRIK